MQLIRIGAERTTIGTASIGVGAASLARAHFRHEPPSPLELENAIAAVEDEIMRAAPPPQPGTMQSDDPHIRQLAARCSAREALSVEAVEQAFNQLAARGVPAPAEAAAALVILRELMHHLGIRTIRLAP